MLGNNHIFSRVTINGFTINPVEDPSALGNIIRGLTEYSELHICDHGTVKTVHKNYLGSKIADPYVVMNESEEDHGLVGTCFLENGYLTIKIWDRAFPAQIQLDLFTTNEILDLDLILDHLCAPAIPHDGLGMFDYTYSKTTLPPPNHILEKNRKEESSYVVNPPVQFFDEFQNDWEVKFNKLGSIFCHFCMNEANNWIFTKTEQMHHAAFKTVAVCDEHVINGKRGELVTKSDGEIVSKDVYNSKEHAEFVLKKEYDEANNTTYSKNILLRKEDNETNS